MATKKFKMTYVVHIIFLLNSAGLAKATKEPPRAVSLGERTSKGRPAMPTSVLTMNFT